MPFLNCVIVSPLEGCGLKLLYFSKHRNLAEWPESLFKVTLMINGGGVGWERQEIPLKPGEEAWSRILPLWPEALAGRQPVSREVSAQFLLDSQAL